ncbi:hypothetical protein QE152_g30547 [Popillia japonica]|uniref:Uncharacterized protein n=1 Tax=Popillia japonica TaxID=7064 RepID=A0AAW1JE74_POPJA
MVEEDRGRQGAIHFTESTLHRIEGQDPGEPLRDDPMEQALYGGPYGNRSPVGWVGSVSFLRDQDGPAGEPGGWGATSVQQGVEERAQCI